MFVFVFVTPPTWQAPHVVLNNRLPRFTCSGVNTIVLPDESLTTVLVASSKSIADAVVTKVLKIHRNNKEKSCEYFLRIIWKNYLQTWNQDNWKLKS